MRNISCREDEIGSLALFSESLDRFDQGAKHDVAIIRITTPNVEIRDMEPSQLHSNKDNSKNELPAKGKL
jgi:hypothetical protein